MQKIHRLGRLAGLELSYRPSIFPVFMILWGILSAIGLWILELPPSSAVAGGLIAVLLHFGSELWHQIGHSAAARRTGHPMSGVLFWAGLATSLYPRGEEDLPGQVHIQRALGGPTNSFLLALAAGLLALALSSTGSTAFWAAVFLCLDNLLVFGLGALLPLGFTDGSTLLYWMKKR